MKSIHVVFPEKVMVRVEEEILAPPEAGEILCATELSLISSGNHR